MNITIDGTETLRPSRRGGRHRGRDRLAEMAMAAMRARDVDALAEACLDILISGGDIDAATLLLVEPHTMRVLPVPFRGARTADFSLDDVDVMALCARAVEGASPVLEESAPDGRTGARRLHISSPLRGRRPEDRADDVLAVLHVVSRPSARIERAELAAVCEMLGVALQNVMRLAYAEQQGRILGGLCEISDRMSESVRLHDALGRALSRVLELVRGESGCIYVRHPGAEAFVLSARQSPPGLLVSEERAIAEGVGELGEVARSRRQCAWRSGEGSEERCHVGVPLQSKAELFGILKVTSLPRESFSSEEMLLLGRLGRQMGVAIESGLQFETISDQATRLSRRTGHLAALLETSERMSRSVEIEGDVDACVQRLSEMMTIPLVLVLVDEGDGMARIVSRFVDRRLGRRARRSAREMRISWRALPVAARSLKSGRMVVVMEGQSDLGAGERRWMRSNDVRSALVVPLVIDGQPHGTLVLASISEPRVFHPSELDFSRTVANQLAIAMERARLFREVRDSARLLENRVSERTQALREANLRLQEVTRQRSDFLKVMSHELRTPLNAVLGFSEIMADPASTLAPDEVREYAGAILQSGTSLLSLINDILDLANRQAATESLHRSAVDVGVVVAGVVEVLRPQALSRTIVLAVEVASDVPVLLTDRPRVKQILYNLISNAIKFSPDGGRVTVSAEMSQGRVCVHIADEGPGIEPALRERVFEPFFQVDAGLGRAHEGAGLGLSLARRDARLLGGDVHLDGAQGGGCIASISLPR